MADEAQGGGWWFPIGQPPPEVLAQMEAQKQHLHMHAQDNTHAIKQLLDDLSVDQLRALDLLVANCGNPMGASYFRGRIEAVLEVKHDVCPCGESHNPDDLLERKVEDHNLPEDPISGAAERAANDMVEAIDYDKLMDEYNVTPVQDELEGRVYCKGCGQHYISLEDRMLRKPGIDGCSGCQQKSAWG